MNRLAIGLLLLASCVAGEAQNVPSSVKAAADSLVGRHFYTCRNAVLFEPSSGGLQKIFEGPRAPHVSAAAELTVVRVGIVPYTPIPGHPGYMVNALMRSAGFSDQYVATTFYESLGLAKGTLLNFGRDSGLRATQISHVSIDKGQPLSDLECVMGDPEQVNQYGDGLEQLVYSGGRLLVYLDPSTSEVVGVQRFGS